MTYNIAMIGDDLISIAAQNAEDAQRIAQHLRQTPDWEWEEVVAGLSSVVVQYNPLSLSHIKARAIIAKTLNNLPVYSQQTAAVITIPVIYGGSDGPDFQMVCERLNWTAHELIHHHTCRTYSVEMIGFLPGFAYIGEFDHPHPIPRLATPRTHVPAGAVGMITGYTGLYALAGPGGWPIIGRTEMSLFHPSAHDPFMIQASSRIRFEAV